MTLLYAWQKSFCTEKSCCRTSRTTMTYCLSAKSCTRILSSLALILVTMSGFHLGVMRQISWSMLLNPFGDLSAILLSVLFNDKWMRTFWVLVVYSLGLTDILQYPQTASYVAACYIRYLSQYIILYVYFLFLCYLFQPLHDLLLLRLTKVYHDRLCPQYLKSFNVWIVANEYDWSGNQCVFLVMDVLCFWQVWRFRKTIFILFSLASCLGFSLVFFPPDCIYANTSFIPFPSCSNAPSTSSTIIIVGFPFITELFFPIASIFSIKALPLLSSDAFNSITSYPQCLATTLAKVVLPHPGGPDSNNSFVWSY